MVELSSKRALDWNACLSMLEGHRDRITKVVFSPDGLLIASSSWDGTTRLWDVTTGSHRATYNHGNMPTALTFSPNSRVIALTDDSIIRLWEVATGEACSLVGHTAYLSDFSFSPDGQNLVSGSDDRTIRLWDIARESCRTFNGHTKRVNAVAYAPNGMLIASASADHSVRLWDVANGSCRILQGNTWSPVCLAFSCSSQLLACGLYTTPALLWNAATGSYLDDGGSAKFSPTDLMKFSPTNESLVAGTRVESVWLWDLTLRTSRRLGTHADEIIALEFSHDGKQITSVSGTEICVWEVATGSCRQHTGYNGSIKATISLSGSQLIATVTSKQVVRLWDTASRMSHTPQGHNGAVSTLQTSLDCHIVASASTEESLLLWHMDLGSCNILVGKIHNSGVLAVSSDGYLVAGAVDSKVHLWSTTTGTYANRALVGHTAYIDALAFSLNGKLLATASRDSTIRLWDVDEGSARLLGYDSSYVKSIAFSPDGKLIVSTHADGRVKLWDVATRRAHTLDRCSVPSSVAAFSSNSQYVIHNYSNKSIKLWEVSTMSSCCVLRGDLVQGDAVTFSRDGTLPHHVVKNNLSLLSRLKQTFAPSPQALYVRPNDSWIWRNSQRLLWLPPDCRPRSVVIRGNTICIGTEYGSVFVLKFRESPGKSSLPCQDVYSSYP